MMLSDDDLKLVGSWCADPMPNPLQMKVVEALQDGVDEVGEDYQHISQCFIEGLGVKGPAFDPARHPQWDPAAGARTLGMKLRVSLRQRPVDGPAVRRLLGQASDEEKKALVREDGALHQELTGLVQYAYEEGGISEEDWSSLIQTLVREMQALAPGVGKEPGQIVGDLQAGAKDPAASAFWPINGKDADTCIATHPFFGHYAKPLQQSCQRAAAGRVHLEGKETFQGNCAAYLLKKGGKDPATKMPYTKQGAAAEAEDALGYVNRVNLPETVHINADDADPSTTIHEAFHLLSCDEFSTVAGHNAEEGTTELFAREVALFHGVPIRQDSYADETRSVRKLATLVDLATLAHAYFHGGMEALKAMVDERKGPGTFAKWVERMEAKKWSAANALLV
jgi:hypothetical protein